MSTHRWPGRYGSNPLASCPGCKLDPSNFTYVGDATWQHTAGDGTLFDLNLNDVIGDLTPLGVAALVSVLDFGALTAAQCSDIIACITTPAGIAQIAAALTAADIPYDNAASGLTATDVQDAIDELAAALNAATHVHVNVGAGASVFQNLTAGNANFRTLVGLEGVSVVVNGDVIDVKFDPASLTPTQLTALASALNAAGLLDDVKVDIDAYPDLAALAGTETLLVEDAVGNEREVSLAAFAAALPVATETLQGKVEIATQAEVDAATLGAPYVLTPATHRGFHQDNRLLLEGFALPTLVHNSFVKLTGWNVTADPDGIIAGDTVTISKSGTYSLNFSPFLSDIGSSNQVRGFAACVFKNGARWKESWLRSDLAGIGFTHAPTAVNGTYELDAGETLEFNVYISWYGAATPSMRVEGVLTYASLTRVG